MSEELNNQPQQEPQPASESNEVQSQPVAENNEVPSQPAATNNTTPPQQAPPQQAPPQQAPSPSSYTSMYEKPAYNNNADAEKPKNNLTLAIVATAANLITCCGYAGIVGLVLGIVGIVFATQVDSKFRSGDIDGAESAAKNAKMCTYISLGLAVLSLFIIIISFVVYGGSAFMDAFNENYNRR